MIAEGSFGPPEGGSGFHYPEMSCPCRSCRYSGLFGGDPARRGYLCPYNKRIAFQALDDIKGLIGALGTLIENVGIAAGIELKGNNGFSDIREENGTRPECPMERMDEETAVRGSNPCIGGQVQEHGG
jgi:hypothetical protein